MMIYYYFLKASEKKVEYNIIINNLLREYMQINIDKASPTNKL